MSKLKINVVRCEDTPAKHSQIVEIELDSKSLPELVLNTIDQEVSPNEVKGLHNAAHHSEYGPVTYLQQVNEGGFGVLVGDPNNLQETYFAAGSLVAFIDDEGPGHASKIGPDGVKRTLRILRGHLST